MGSDSRIQIVYESYELRVYKTTGCVDLRPKNYFFNGQYLYYSVRYRILSISLKSGKYFIGTKYLGEKCTKKSKFDKMWHEIVLQNALKQSHFPCW